jgi:dihydroorotase
VLPGLIDDQVHFREPGLTHKGEMRTEARAAVAGGITSYMEMPNTSPPTLTQELLAHKYARAAEVSLANYSFFMGVSNDNLDEVLRTDPRTVCGVKVFMGSSTGNLLVDDEHVLDRLFASTPMLVATHCEDEATIRANAANARAQFADDVPIAQHPVIRSAEACYLSSSRAVALARKHGTRLHVLHISTAREVELFQPGPVAAKHITAEACIHHLWFCDEDYARLGAHIKWNPAVKTAHDRQAVWEALLHDRIDVVATDHAPHTLEEKARPYWDCPSGGPLVQHSLLALLQLATQRGPGPEWVAQKGAHAVADLFRIAQRGYIREGYWADLALVDPPPPPPRNPPKPALQMRLEPLHGAYLPA